MADKYDFTPETRDKILAVFLERVKVLRCPLCNHDAFTTVEGFVSATVYKNFWLAQRTSGLPSLALVCDHCGNTLFINIGALGLADLVNPSQEELKGRFGIGILRTR
jgi:hypothetical protein